MPKTLGEKIRQRRKKLNWTLEHLAKETGSSKSYIWELENKNPERPSAKKLKLIAEKLGITLEYLMDSDSSINIESAEDLAFYRKYKTMNDTTRDRIRKMLDLLDDEG